MSGLESLTERRSNFTVSLPKKMEVRPLGSQGLSSPAQGYGCMGLTWAYAPSAEPAEVERTAEEAIAKALSLGINHLDTACV